MKNLINAFLTGLVNIALHGYFRKMIVQGKENIPKNVPIILVANHQNALIDPLLIATQSKLKPWFLTRASAFKKPLVAKLLNFIRMLPVFRVRDGFSTITQNQQTFDQTYEVLKANGTVIIFAEGTHHLERNLFPLSKGFTRMAFGLKEHFPEKEPVILPVGINYSAHQKSGSIVRMSFGECIPVNMTSAQSGKLTKSVERALKELIVEIPNEGYEESLKNLIDNGIDLSNKNEIEAFLNQSRIPEKRSNRSHSSLINKMMKIFHLPLFLFWLWVKTKIQDPVFVSTFKFLIGFVFAPLWYGLLLWLSFNPRIGPEALSVLLMAWITLYFNKNPQE